MRPVVAAAGMSPVRWWLLAFSLWALLGAANVPGYGDPVVVVYPLTVTGPAGEQAGGNVALLLATKLAQLGGVTVKPYTPGTQRSDYLDAARRDGADYYIAGFMTPVGPELSMIVQVVSTTSGSVVSSTTTMVRTYGDAVGQADELRTAIVRHAGRGLAALEAPAPAPSGTPVANASGGGGVDLTKALRRRQRAAPAASPSPASASPTASVAVPAPAASPGRQTSLATPTSLVVQVGGTAAVEQRNYATSALASALRHSGTASGVLGGVSVEEATAHAADLCRANAGARTLYAGTLSVASGAKSPNVTLEVAAYDCTGALRGRRRGQSPATRGNVDAAIDRAAAQATAAFGKAGAA